MFDTLFKRYHDEILILTPTGRLAFFLKQHAPAITAPKIYPLHEWLLTYWQNNLDAGYLTPKLMLNDKQTQLLWQKIITSTIEAPLLMQPIATATTAKQAWQIAQQWEIDWENPLFDYHEDCKIWHQWANTLTTLYKKNQWTDQIHFLKDCLAAWRKQQPLLPLPKEIWLIGFSQFKPYEKTLIDLWRTLGVNCQSIHLNEATESCAQLACDDLQTEWRYFAQWAKQQSHDQTIGFIVPNLTQHQKALQHVLREYFPDSNTYHFSLGMPLHQYPLIQSALSALRLLQTEIAFHDLSQWLLSPYFTTSENLSARAQREARLRETCGPYLPTIFEHAKKIKSGQTHHPHEWSTLFQEHLQTLGWLKEVDLTEQEKNLLSHWQALLNNFASLSIVDYPLTLTEAIEQISTLAEQTILPTTNNFAPIQIMGMLEASGLVFDQLWISGWHHLAWPSKVAANPFLPLTLQQKAGVPHSGAEQELAFCQTLTQELCQSAKHIIVSYPQQVEAQSVKPSVLIQHLPEISWEALNISTTPTSLEKLYAQKPALLENFLDNTGPTLAQYTNKHHGSAIFKEQAACPFRAFVRLRLGGHSLPNVQAGFSARVRGEMIHAILEKLWRQLGTQAALQKLSADDLAELVEKICWTVLKQTSQRYENLFAKQFFTLEKQRLQTLALQWLHYEKERAPFVVVATEQKIETHFSKLDLKLRVDRIDQLNDGSHMIIDYKTSECQTHTWFGDRPDEPQLPLYYVVSALPVEQIAFAQLRADDIAFKSLVIEKGEKERWEKILAHLANEYSTGVADVRPKDGEQTCRYCDLASVCRIRQIT